MINKWENKTGAPTFETRGVTERASNDDIYTFGYGVARKEILEDLKQLEEPQKPVVPKFVAEWFEDNKHALDLAIFIAIRGLDEEEWPHKTDFENWLDVSKNKPIETLIRMKDGYEVEKEPLYYVRLPYEVWDEEAAELKTEYLYLHYEITSDETRIFPTKEPRKGFVTKLDELTIKSADERYWPFAVPVEEVVER
ncbi:DUF1642 domain-containing protein [Enterococcus faecium]|nr:DUF1642 domain-containing protein [Enterococcus faecium]MDB7374012.1 DUF1642 domain-containing protein [Enterococcus faecium]MDB7382562.1 DUF1642 domain-containing protein [Enterococcus faecium]MDB7397249.1 DUF1642 domain-containing protein [Enterococcus faecium]MDB7562518.1 DUF1642 domain-containing protein [Enterococcus faecium]